MSESSTSTRRAFLKNGTMLAAPLAAVAAPAAVMADGELKQRVALLENEAAIRELHQAWLRRVNTGLDAGMNSGIGTGVGDAGVVAAAIPEAASLDASVRTITADHSGQPDAIEVAADGKNAAGRFHCLVEIETSITPDCTLAQMAHAQGSGFVRRTERRVLHAEYVKSSGVWAMARVTLHDPLERETK